MKVSVLGPSAEYQTYAGARIRYDRLAPELAKRNVDLSLVDVADFVPHEDDSDVIVVSKCYDARALVAAAVFAKRGRLVGVDLFDDYFSQENDSRLSRYRLWLEELLPSCQFALVSTPQLASFLESRNVDLRVHLVNDPGPAAGREDLPAKLQASLAHARDENRIRVAWFGVGDNPHFPIGLEDLAAFAPALRELSAGGMDVELQVLTNPRALTADGLSRLGRLPVRTLVEEWTEDRESVLLEQAFVAFLPVGVQPFSIAKSLNRAVTALAAGCQVLSIGYPLYRPLAPLIYRDASKLMRDLQAGSLRHSPDTLETYDEIMASFASAETEAARLAHFLSELRPGEEDKKTVVLVHGFATNGVAHKMVQAAGGLSVASPSCTTPLGFDAIFQEGLDSLKMLVSAKASRQLRSGLEDRLEPAGNIRERKFFELRVTTEARRDRPLNPEERLPLQLATYSYAMSEIRSRLEQVFGPCRIILSENSQLPFAAN